MTTGADHLYASRAELKKLSTYLRGMRELMVDMTVTIAKLDRIGTKVRVRRVRKQSELDPMNFDAAACADELHNAVTGWVRLVCEKRKLPVPAGLDVTHKAAEWLDDNLMSLGMTEGAERALDDIGKAFDRCLHHVVPRPEPIIVDQAQVVRARDEELNASGIETAARELGEEYRHLTRKRVNNLHQCGHIAPARVSLTAGIPVYRLGDVLDAHLRVPIRKRA
jgi:hypothetical protein